MSEIIKCELCGTPVFVEYDDEAEACPTCGEMV